MSLEVLLELRFAQERDSSPTPFPPPVPPAPFLSFCIPVPLLFSALFLLALRVPLLLSSLPACRNTPFPALVPPAPLHLIHAPFLSRAGDYDPKVHNGSY